MAPKTIREKLMSWVQNTTFHGIPNISIADRKPVKVMWILCIIISTCYCGYILVTTTIDYLRYEVKTVVDVLRDSDAVFPTITYCYMLQCGASRSLKDYNTNVYLFRALNATGNYNESTIEEILRKMDSQTALKLFKDEFFKSLDQANKSINSLEFKNNYIISCQYSGEFCYTNDFDLYRLNDFQSCFTFNSGKYPNGTERKLKQARRYGKSYGLQLELYVGTRDYCTSPLSSTAGIVLYVHNSSDIITEDSNGIHLAPGTETNIAIDRTFVSQLPYPYSNCIENTAKQENIPNDMIRKTLELGLYSQQTCFILCYQDFVLKNYNCYDGLTLLDPSLDSNLYNKCPENSTAKRDFSAGEHDKKCIEKCPNACDYVTYDLTVSSSQFPSQTYMEVLIKNQNISKFYSSDNSFETVENSILSLNIYYKTDLYTKIRDKESIVFESYISNVGGNVTFLKLEFSCN
jgi:hypothetical protein